MSFLDKVSKFDLTFRGSYARLESEFIKHRFDKDYLPNIITMVVGVCIYVAYGIFNLVTSNGPIDILHLSLSVPLLMSVCMMIMVGRERRIIKRIALCISQLLLSIGTLTILVHNGLSSGMVYAFGGILFLTYLFTMIRLRFVDLIIIAILSLSYYIWYSDYHLISGMDNFNSYSILYLIVGLIFLLITTYRRDYEWRNSYLTSKIFEEMAYRDQLTGTYNRRYLEQVLTQYIHLVKTSNKLFSVVLLDVDFFKKYNDHYGHIEGDFCLRSVASCLIDSTFNVNSLVARYGGEEFVIVLPDADKAAAEKVIVNVIKSMRSRALPHAQSPQYNIVTISAGIATIDCNSQINGIDDVLSLADKNLYKAKESGRNCYCVD